MKSSVYSKILCITAVAVVCACVIFETAALLWRDSSAVPAWAETEEKSVYEINEDDAALLARFVYAAAGDEPFLCKVAVAAVIFNRMQDSGYPSTVSEVIAADKYFDNIEADTADSEGIRSAENAVRQAMNGEDPTNGALFFYRSDDKKAAGEVTFYASGMIFTR